MAEFATGYQKVGSATLVGGDTAGTHIAREQAAGLAAAFDSVKSATGVDLGATLQGQVSGRGATRFGRSREPLIVRCCPLPQWGGGEVGPMTTSGSSTTRVGVAQ